MKAYVLFDSWAGRTKTRVTVLKECEKRSQVRFEEAAFGRAAGHIQYVPNHAIRKDPTQDKGNLYSSGRVSLTEEWYGPSGQPISVREEE